MHAFDHIYGRHSYILHTLNATHSSDEAFYRGSIGILCAERDLVAIAQRVLAKQQIDIYLKLLAEGLILKLLILSHVTHIDTHLRSLYSLGNLRHLLLREVVGNLYRHHHTRLQLARSTKRGEGYVADNAKHE